MIYVDTGAFIARYAARDQYHATAQECWSRIGSDRPPLATSNFVLDETFTLLGRAAGNAFAAAKAKLIYGLPALKIIRPGRDEEMAALDLFVKFADQKVSFTDCISFVLMRLEGIGRAFTFDRHFRDAGFEAWPDSATG